MNAVCIRTLGPPVVRVNGAELVALPAQRLRCALLVFLAVERETTRENVLATFWPERPVERARHAFSQTLYELRRLLGDDWVDVQGERVVVRGIAVDAVELEAAVARGDTETAVRLYGGPFLDGFALDPKPFEAWAERRRAQLGRSHRKASRERIAALLQAGNLAAALEVSRRWAELDPLEDEAEHRYLELLVQAGHRGDALRVYAEYERLLQRELQVEPLDETKALVARLRAGELESGPAWGEVQRARLQADISELNVLGVVNATGDAGTVQAPRDTRSSVAPSAARVEPVPANRRSSHLDRLAFALGGAAVLALLILGYGSSSSHSSASRVTPGAAGSAPAVAILPFGVSDPALQKWRTGVLLSLAAGIDGAAGMHAVDPQAVLESLNENAGSANTISHAPDRSQALGVGRRTGARYAIAGNVVAIDSSVRITADLYETATGARLQEFQSEGSSAQMFALLDALAIEIIRTMVRRERRDAGVSRTDVGGHLTTSLPALKAYLQAIRDRGLKTSSQRKVFTCLSSFYAFMVDENLLGANPIIPFRRRYLRQYKDNGSEPRQLISIDQAAMLINSVLHSRDKAFLTLLFKTGMRLGELCSLDVGDLDLHDMSLVLKPTAKRSNRQLFFDHETARMLQAWLASRQDVNSGSPLFISTRKQRISPEVIPLVRSISSWAARRSR